MSNKKRINNKIYHLESKQRLITLRNAARIMIKIINESIEFQKRKSNALSSYPVGA